MIGSDQVNHNQYKNFNLIPIHVFMKLKIRLHATTIDEHDDWNICITIYIINITLDFAFKLIETCDWLSIQSTIKMIIS